MAIPTWKPLRDKIGTEVKIQFLCIKSSLSIDYLIYVDTCGHNKDSSRISQTWCTERHIFTLCSRVVISHLSHNQQPDGLQRSNDSQYIRGLLKGLFLLLSLSFLLPFSFLPSFFSPALCLSHILWWLSKQHICTNKFHLKIISFKVKYLIKE